MIVNNKVKAIIYIPFTVDNFYLNLFLIKTIYKVTSPFVEIFQLTAIK